MKTRVFEGLNYSFGNEDCSVEASLLAIDASHIASVCHSGAQLIPFLAKRPKAITFIDLSREQLIIAELRLELLRALDFNGFKRFWGYSDDESISFRKETLANLSFEYRDVVVSWMQEAGWQSPLYIGKWERTAAKLGNIYQKVLGSAGLAIFECTTLEEQHNFLATRFPMHRFKAVVRIAATLAATYALLKPSEFPPGTKATQFYAEYSRIFGAILQTGVARENFFFELLMFGRIKTATPLEARCDYYERAREWVDSCDVRFVKRDVFDFLQSSKQSFDFVTLSNVTSYGVGTRRTDYLQEIKGCLREDSRVVVRNFLSGAQPVADGYEDQTQELRSILDQECTHVYDMSVYRRC